jgi:hypothetical protein
MTLLEKTQKSSANNKFTLFKEGLFYKCYNEDAMVFTEKVKKYKVSARFIKTVGSQVLSVGFPLAVGGKNNLTLDTIALAVDAISFLEREMSVVFILKNKDLHDYPRFKESILASVNEPLVAKNNTARCSLSSKIEQKIQEFDLVNSSPMQCILFVQELKKMLLNTNKE